MCSVVPVRKFVQRRIHDNKNIYCKTEINKNKIYLFYN